MWFMHWILLFGHWSICNFFSHHSLLVSFMLLYAFIVVSNYKQKNTIWTANIFVPWWWKRWQTESSQPNFTTICFMKKKNWLNFAHQNDLYILVIARNLRFLIWNFYHNGIWSICTITNCIEMNITTSSL